MRPSLIVLLYLLGLVIHELWSSARWDISHYAALATTLVAFCFALLRYKLLLHCLVVLLSSTAAAFLARVGFRLWMEEGFFQWRWLEYLPEKTNASGEGAYLLVELQMFMLSYIALFSALFGILSAWQYLLAARRAA
jgi:hypothetical protein